MIPDGGCNNKNITMSNALIKMLYAQTTPYTIDTTPHAFFTLSLSHDHSSYTNFTSIKIQKIMNLMYKKTIKQKTIRPQ